MNNQNKKRNIEMKEKEEIVEEEKEEDKKNTKTKNNKNFFREVITLIWAEIICNIIARIY